MTEIERFWLDLMDARRYAITEVYGAECASRYNPHPIEREYFINNRGTFSEHPSNRTHKSVLGDVRNALHDTARGVPHEAQGELAQGAAINRIQKPQA